MAALVLRLLILSCACAQRAVAQTSDTSQAAGTTPAPLSKSDQNCLRYAASISPASQLSTGYVRRTNCVLPTRLFARALMKPFIVGGVKAKSKEFPHMAAIGFGPSSAIKWRCGGTLISERFVLTAAHCLEDFSFFGIGRARWVRLGDFDLNSTSDDEGVQEFSVVSRIYHPNYIYPKKYDDIGLLKLNATAVFTLYVGPACLHTTKDIPSTHAVATGWGVTSFGGSYSSELLKVNLTLFTNKYCRDRIGVDTNTLSQGVLDASMLCAGEPEGGKDTCQGDSGGPLQIPRPNTSCMYNIIGITSFGQGCALANSSAVYTRVSNYVPWIEKNVWP